MIESLTIAGPLALVRAQTLPPAADLPRPEPLAAPNPDAPVGPKPTFAVTPMERLREDLRAAPRPDPKTADAATDRRDEATEAPAGPRTEPAGTFPEPKDAPRLDLRA